MHHESQKEDWSPEEYARLKALPDHRMPSRNLKRRTIEAAIAGGYLRPRRYRIARRIVLLAAASVIFAAGTLLGYALARRTKLPAAASRSANAEAVASTGFTINNDPRRRIVWY